MTEDFMTEDAFTDWTDWRAVGPVVRSEYELDLRAATAQQSCFPCGWPRGAPAHRDPCPRNADYAIYPAGQRGTGGLLVCCQHARQSGWSV